jgi:hypothetical protein
MRRKHVGMAVAVGLLAVGSCGADAPAPGRLVDYAEGDWACDLDVGAEPTVDAAITVTAEGDTNGNYTAQLAVPDAPAETIEGDWALDGTDLEVTALDDAVRYAIEGAALDTDHLEVVQAGRGHVPVPVDVDVERHGADVAFQWEHPWRDEPVDMSCARA